MNPIEKPAWMPMPPLTCEERDEWPAHPLDSPLLRYHQTKPPEQRNPMATKPHGRDPWANAPPWAVALRDMLGLALRVDVKIMSAIEDVLTQAEAAAKAIADLKAAGTDPATIARIQSLSDSLTAKAATLAAAVVAGTPHE